MKPLYLDTSCLLKLFWNEPETAAVEAIVMGEAEVVVSDLARLEFTTRVHARRTGGLLTPAAARRLVDRSDALIATPPFVLRATGPTLIQDARNHIDVSRADGHCRTLDRLHLSAMVAMGLDRLLTNDDAQARAARSAGISVVLPR